MKNNTSKNVWIGTEDLSRNPEFMENAGNEFKDTPLFEMLGEEDAGKNLKSNRRDFLKFLGFGLGAATIAAGCDIPVKRAIPYVVKPEEIVPGVATYYASSIVRGGDFCPVLVKTREGRPIKIEGNSKSTITRGGTSARAQAEVLELYNTNRLKAPLKKNEKKYEEMEWAAFDEEIISKFNASKGIRVVSSTNMSPTSEKVLKEFVQAYPVTKIVKYDPVSSAAMLKANEQSFGIRAIPDFKFNMADVIVSFNADFLGTWISPTEYAASYAEKRRIEDVKHASMSRHIQVESHMSLTGSNADNRILVKPSEQGAAIVKLYNELAKKSGASTLKNLPLNDKADKALKLVADELMNAKGASLVICGNNNVGQQVIVNKINDLLGNLNKTVDFANTINTRQGDESGLYEMIRDIENGLVDTVVFHDVNPLYDFAGKSALSAALGTVSTKVAVCYTMTETSSQCDLIAPHHHVLESWGDVNPKAGKYSLIQPVISPLFNTRQAETSFLTWIGKASGEKEKVYYNYLKSNWQNGLLQGLFSGEVYDKKWDALLKEGLYEKEVPAVTVSFNADLNEAIGQIDKSENSELEISFFENVNIGNGQYAENPWLQEMPNPIDRTVWGNHLTIPIGFDGDNRYESFRDLKDGDKVELEVNGIKLELPVVRVFGQMQGTVGLALGYGRESAGRVGTGVGVDANQLLAAKDDLTQYYAENITVSERTGKDKDFACVQYHHTIGVTAVDPETGEKFNADERELVDDFWKNFTSGFQGALTDRSIIFNANLSELEEKVEALQHFRHHAQELNDRQIYNGYDELYEMGHHWGMHIDLNACTGCGACTVACMAENNVPVVGKHEVSRHHEMSWLRIDRYFYGDVENPNVVYQPMLCQHCDNAPCENVCPVNATNHSEEGLNQMAYNRCIGTRYCANNCPYKVRRFNWLDYSTADIHYNNEPALHKGNKKYGDDSLVFGHEDLTRMVLNPDVTVRSRGVIEKCSFCVQRLQEGKLTAKREGRDLMDSDVRTACQMACATNAITFGDMNNQHGDISNKLKSPLNYYVLEEVNVRSSVCYTMKVNNRNEALDA
jgi:molybdopterin-containing oxidoreductase family iron-sulfur binding subunit